MFTVHRNITPPIFREAFHRRDISYNLSSNSKLAKPNARSIHNGGDSISWLLNMGYCAIGTEVKQVSMPSKKELRSESQKTIRGDNSYQIYISSKFFLVACLAIFSYS